MTEINIKNFARICGLNGYQVREVVAKSKRNKSTIYKALREPHNFGPTVEVLERLLPVREVPEVVNGR